MLVILIFFTENKHFICSVNFLPKYGRLTIDEVCGLHTVIIIIQFLLYDRRHQHLPSPLSELGTGVYVAWLDYYVHFRYIAFVL